MILPNVYISPVYALLSRRNNRVLMLKVVNEVDRLLDCIEVTRVCQVLPLVEEWLWNIAPSPM
jgi:hypothetical protein